MAILPRTILTQSAPAAVAAVSLFGFTIIGMSAHETYEREQLHHSYTAPCADKEAELGPRKYWGEQDFVRYAWCFDEVGDSVGVVQVSTQGLGRYPQSESLYNLKGYHELQLREFDAAVDTLEVGLRTVKPTNGVMENNLAWAYLWVGDGHRDRARALYLSSLARDPSVCEVVHTGMFVEFQRARMGGPLSQADALRNFQQLRETYTACENRDTKWATAVEAAGAAVLYDEVHKMLGLPYDQIDNNPTLHVTASSLRANHPAASPALLCREAMPLADLRDDCSRSIQNALRARAH